MLTGSFRDSVDFGGGTRTSAGGGDIVVLKLDADGNHLWSRTFGDTNGDDGYGVAVDGSDNVLVTGRFRGSVDFGGGTRTAAGIDVFVLKLDASGSHLWSQTFGDSSGQIGTAVAVDDSGNVVITGQFTGSPDFGGGPLPSAGNSDIFVAKLDSSGGHLWSKGLGGADTDQGRSVATDTMGNVVITGDFEGAVDFGGGTLTAAAGAELFIAKYDGSGNHVWSNRFGGLNDERGYAVATDSANNVVVGGFFRDEVDFGGGPLDGHTADLFVAKYDSAGNHLWSKDNTAFPGGGNGHGLAIDGTGHVIMTGLFGTELDLGGPPLNGAGSNDIFLAKFAP